MRQHSFITLAVTLALMTSCKKPESSGPDSSTNASAVQKRSNTQDQKQQGTFPTPYDVQEFYEIARASYIKDLRALGEDGLSQAEEEFMKSFNVNTKYVGQMVDLAETMFQLLESGRYQQKLHGVKRLEKVTRNVPKGLTDKHLEQFFQIMKMEYIKRVTKRPAPEMDARESGFYSRIQDKTDNQAIQAAPVDVLLLASDLFDKIEGVK